MERINDIKERFLIQVEDVTMVLKKRNKTVSEVTKALYDFLAKEELQKKVKEYEIRFGNDGELALEKEYGQVYRIVIELFDKFVELLGEEQIALKEYCELLDAGLEEGILKEPVSRTSRRCFCLEPMTCIFQEKKMREVFSQSMTGSCYKKEEWYWLRERKKKHSFRSFISIC